MKMLLIGNSHSLDVFHLLKEVLDAHLPEEQTVLGVLYYQGCSITQHIDFYEKATPVYRYYKNESGSWEILRDCTFETALRDEPWDVVFTQAAKSDLDETMNLAGRRRLKEIVDRYLPRGYVNAWHTSWPSPNDETFFSPTYHRQPPAGYKDRLVELYGFDPIRQFTVLTEMGKKHILTDDAYSLAVCSGGAILFAHLQLKVPQLALWRDYTHLSDYGRIIVAYAMFAQLTGKPVERILVNRIPAPLRFSEQSEDLILTDAMKEVILRSANHSLAHPWAVPQ